MIKALPMAKTEPEIIFLFRFDILHLPLMNQPHELTLHRNFAEAPKIKPNGIVINMLPEIEPKSAQAIAPNFPEREA
jgi:hypothetical protein